MTGFIMKKLKNLIKEASLKELVVSINPDIIGKDYSFKPDKLITGELKSQVDKIWEAFWTGGISNPLSVIEQFTYYFL
jgi:hypothetical protein